ncbi:MAG: DUF5615 family PIN-like protein [Proteobacteria bacterium]|nr:DUF5615 family PIN-like protein [Pseudomonadota bacterium]
MTFFFDNNMSPKMAEGMKAFGEDIVYLKELFSDGTEDVVWLEYIGDNGIYLITRDDRILRNPAEKKAFVEHNVGGFFVGGQQLTRCDLIRNIVRNWHHIKSFAQKNHKPFAAKIPRSGSKIKSLNLS